MKKHFSKKQKRTLRLYRSISVGLIVLCMAVGTLTGLLFFARPAASQIENRTLASFPAFSLGSFLDGSWFGQIALWYSDTYPGRDTLLKVQHHFDQLKGIQSNEMVIGVGQADTIGKTVRILQRPPKRQTRMEPTTLPNPNMTPARKFRMRMRWPKIFRARSWKVCWYVMGV